MTKRRVVVTGLGVLAPNGNSVGDYWKSISNGISGIKEISSFDASSLTVRIAGELDGFDPNEHFDRKELKKLDLFTIYHIVSSREAIEQSGFKKHNIDHDRIGVIIGSGIGGIQTLEQQAKIYNERGQRRVSPFFVPRMIANIAAGNLAIEFGLKGPNHTVISACASGTDAIGCAARTIQYGDADVMVTGGTEASITGLTISGFANIRALSTQNDNPSKASKPFDKDRDGFVLSEGSATIVLEELEHAKKRGAKIIAEFAGYGSTDDAYHVTQPSEGGVGAIKAMSNALKDSNLNTSDINYINAHGTSTPFNDKTESSAIKNLFSEHSKNLKISSTKSMIGHSLGASGALEAIASILAIQNNEIPPTINYKTPDPECDLDYVPNVSVKQNVDAVMSNSFGFGGHNGVCLLYTSPSPRDLSTSRMPSSA